MYDNAKMQHALRFKPLQKPAPIFKIPANFKKPQIFPAQELSFPPENFDRFPAEILHDRVCSAGCLIGVPDILKKVVLHSVATAFASNVFPVPGGP